MRESHFTPYSIYATTLMRTQLRKGWINTKKASSVKLNIQTCF